MKLNIQRHVNSSGSLSRKVIETAGTNEGLHVDRRSSSLNRTGMGVGVDERDKYTERVLADDAWLTSSFFLTLSKHRMDTLRGAMLCVPPSSTYSQPPLPLTSTSTHTSTAAVPTAVNIPSSTTAITASKPATPSSSLPPSAPSSSATPAAVITGGVSTNANERIKTDNDKYRTAHSTKQDLTGTVDQRSHYLHLDSLTFTEKADPFLEFQNTKTSRYSLWKSKQFFTEILQHQLKQEAMREAVELGSFQIPGSIRSGGRNVNGVGNGMKSKSTSVDNSFYSNDPLSIIKMQNGKIVSRSTPVVLKISEINYDFKSYDSIPGVGDEDDKITYRNNVTSSYQFLAKQEVYVRVTLGAWTTRTKARTLRHLESLNWKNLNLSVLMTAECLEYGGELLVELLNSNLSLDSVVVGRARVGISGILGEINAHYFILLKNIPFYSSLYRSFLSFVFTIHFYHVFLSILLSFASIITGELTGEDVSFTSPLKDQRNRPAVGTLSLTVTAQPADSVMIPPYNTPLPLPIPPSQSLSQSLRLPPPGSRSASQKQNENEYPSNDPRSMPPNDPRLTVINVTEKSMTLKADINTLQSIRKVLTQDPQSGQLIGSRRSSANSTGGKVGDTTGTGTGTGGVVSNSRKGSVGGVSKSSGNSVGEGKEVVGVDKGKENASASGKMNPIDGDLDLDQDNSSDGGAAGGWGQAVRDDEVVRESWQGKGGEGGGGGENGYGDGMEEDPDTNYSGEEMALRLMEAEARNEMAIEDINQAEKVKVPEEEGDGGGEGEGEVVDLESEISGIKTQDPFSGLFPLKRRTGEVTICLTISTFYLDFLICFILLYCTVLYCI